MLAIIQLNMPGICYISTFGPSFTQNLNDNFTLDLSSKTWMLQIPISLIWEFFRTFLALFSAEFKVCTTQNVVSTTSSVPPHLYIGSGQFP